VHRFDDQTVLATELYEEEREVGTIDEEPTGFAAWFEWHVRLAGEEETVAIRHELKPSRAAAVHARVRRRVLDGQRVGDRRRALAVAEEL
jgi:hypothetical protein